MESNVEPKIDESSNFLTGVNIAVKKPKEFLPEIVSTQQCHSFFEIAIPKYDPNQLALPIPVDLPKIKKNANSSIANSSNVKFDDFLRNNPNLNPLADALVSDSFWFIVHLFQTRNQNYGKKNLEENNDIKSKRQSRSVSKGIKLNKSNISSNLFNSLSNVNDRKDNIAQEMLLRMSKNYFKYFIRVCDLGQTRTRDNYLNEFKNFMSFSVFYAIYLAFPKSRHLFNEKFRNRIVGIFSYLFNGLTTENHFYNLKWELDLGKGNIIEKFPPLKPEDELVLPELSELQALLEDNYQISKYRKAKQTKGKNGIKKKEEINSDILNTPLYRLYAEKNKFETLNLLKPIKMTNRKIIDINAANKQHAAYVKFAKDAIQRNKDANNKYKEEDNKRNEEYARQIKIIRKNDQRLKEEMAEIKTLRVQEYANYLLFISK